MSEPVYAGIGSRSAPPEVLDLCARIAQCLRVESWRLATGHAPGCDQAFEEGASGAADIFLPWPSFNAQTPIHPDARVFARPAPDAHAEAERHHSAWGFLGEPVRALMARNCHQVLGWDLRSPVARIVCWTPDAAMVGGTAMALRIAADWRIPVYNLADARTRRRLLAELGLADPVPVLF